MKIIPLFVAAVLLPIPALAYCPPPPPSGLIPPCTFDGYQPMTVDPPTYQPPVYQQNYVPAADDGERQMRFLLQGIEDGNSPQ